MDHVLFSVRLKFTRGVSTGTLLVLFNELINHVIEYMLYISHVELINSLFSSYTYAIHIGRETSRVLH